MGTTGIHQFAKPENLYLYAENMDSALILDVHWIDMPKGQNLMFEIISRLKDMRTLHIDFRHIHAWSNTKHSNKSQLTCFNIFGVAVAVNVAIQVLSWGLEMLPSHC